MLSSRTYFLAINRLLINEIREYTNLIQFDYVSSAFFIFKPVLSDFCFTDLFLIWYFSLISFACENDQTRTYNCIINFNKFKGTSLSTCYAALSQRYLKLELTPESVKIFSTMSWELILFVTVFIFARNIVPHIWKMFWQYSFISHSLPLSIMLFSICSTSFSVWATNKN